ncbi:AAA family ATPase [Humidisolicoccus flavus]|uniref:AAA family ATPase n=1 Tax=Humidisolicoccus flavus TaxID=3111414 RepID=UPI003255C055
MATFAVSAALRREDALIQDAVAHGHTVAIRAGSPEELCERLQHTSVDVVVVQGAPAHCSQSLLAACDSLGVRLVVISENAAERSFAKRLGILDPVDSKAGFAAIESAIVAEQPSARPRLGRVIAVWGAPGAPGRTTVATGLATEFAVLGHKVLLCDVDTHGASVATTLGLLDEAPGFAAACRLARAAALTGSELDRVSDEFTGYFGSYSVLSGISAAHRWTELSGDRVEKVIRACREWADITILDLASSIESDEEVSSDMFAPRRNGATVAALEAADTVLAVGTGDPVGITRFLRSFRDLQEQIKPAEVRVVMNKIRVSAMGLAPEQAVRQTLARFGGIHSVDVLHFDLRATDAALLSAKSIRDVAPRSKLRKGLTALAEAVLAGSETGNDEVAAPRTRRAARESDRPPRRWWKGHLAPRAHVRDVH